MLSSVLGLVILVLDILAIVNCVQSSMETGKKVLWVVLILILPLIGLVLYYLVGRGKTV